MAARATNATSDKQQAVAMVEETTGNVGAVPREVSADAGYYSVKAVEELYALGANPFIAPEKTRHGRVLEPAPRGRIPKGLSVRDRMRRKLRTKRGRERYAFRMETVEPVVGQIKQGRGFRQFLLRRLAKVNREWLLICAGHNLLKLFRFGAGMSGNVRAKAPLGTTRSRARPSAVGFSRDDPDMSIRIVHPHHAGFVATGNPGRSTGSVGQSSDRLLAQRGWVLRLDPALRPSYDWPVNRVPVGNRLYCCVVGALGNIPRFVIVNACVLGKETSYA